MSLSYVVQCHILSVGVSPEYVVFLLCLLLLIACFVHAESFVLHLLSIDYDILCSVGYSFVYLCKIWR